MDIENCTQDDAKVKVSAGPVGMGQHEMEWDLPHGRTLTLPDPSGPRVTFSIKVGKIEIRREEITPTEITGLRLQKSGKGYLIKPIRQARRDSVAGSHVPRPLLKTGPPVLRPLAKIRRSETVPRPEVETEIQAVAGERSQFLARKHGGKKLSLGEQERLESLTERLRELLPPVSVSELEVLLAMAEEAEDIRKRAQERRQRLGIA